MTTVPAWSDIIDLMHPEPGLTRHLIDSLALWVRRGVDGFRCDVASLVPVAFWVQARAELAAIRPGLLWLAETVHPSMVEARRAAGIPTAGGGEMFEAFDVEYQYDLWSIWQSAVVGTVPVGRFLEMLRWQGATPSARYAKLRFVENHDQYRIQHLAPTPEQALAWTVLMACARGPFLVYAGQEPAARRWPSLFEPDPVEWGAYELTGPISALARLKKHPAMGTGQVLGPRRRTVRPGRVGRQGRRRAHPRAGRPGPARRRRRVPGRAVDVALLDVFLHVETLGEE